MKPMNYYLIGSPCCGKSTLARALSQRYGLPHVCCDDFETPFLDRGERQGVEAVRRLAQRLRGGRDDMWLRPSETLLRDELAYYEATFEWLMEALEEMPAPVIAEGAALLPWRLAARGISAQQVICMTPTPRFQREQYARREWVAPFLASCSDPERAFSNWMGRDERFALLVAEGAHRAGYPHGLVDGGRNLEQTLEWAEKLLNLTP